MYYDVVVNHDYDKACELYDALVKINCSHLLGPYVCYLRETVKRNLSHPCRYGYRIDKDVNGVYTYKCYLDRDESTNFISLDKFLNTIQPERTVRL
jgi:hypothetical protein